MIFILFYESISYPIKLYTYMNILQDNKIKISNDSGDFIREQVGICV